ncbi:MAG: 3'-5' exonuclease [Bacteroidota bacterium]
MQFIVFDLEATCWQDGVFNNESEIIEIGAFKLNEYGEILDKFEKFVKPIIHPILSSYCKYLTNIDQVQVNRANTFDIVGEAFKEWIDIDQPYVLCAWGKFDANLLRRDCDLHKMEKDWIDPYINVKKQYHSIKNKSKTNGLSKTLDLEGFEFEGTPHRANVDAYNLAKIFAKHIDAWQY